MCRDDKTDDDFQAGLGAADWLVSQADAVRDRFADTVAAAGT